MRRVNVVLAVEHEKSYKATNSTETESLSEKKSHFREKKTCFKQFKSDIIKDVLTLKDTYKPGDIKLELVGTGSFNKI